MILPLPHRLHTCGREFETVRQARQVDRVSQRNAADALLSGKFEEFRHCGFSLPFLGPPFSIAVSASKGGFRLRQLTEAETTEADSLDDHFAVSYTKVFRVGQTRPSFSCGCCLQLALNDALYRCLPPHHSQEMWAGLSGQVRYSGKMAPVRKSGG
jgi:hypothetical protein